MKDADFLDFSSPARPYCLSFTSFRGDFTKRANPRMSKRLFNSQSLKSEQTRIGASLGTTGSRFIHPRAVEILLPHTAISPAFNLTLRSEVRFAPSAAAREARRRPDFGKRQRRSTATVGYEPRPITINSRAVTSPAKEHRAIHIAPARTTRAASRDVGCVRLERNESSSHEQGGIYSAGDRHPGAGIVTIKDE